MKVYRLVDNNNILLISQTSKLHANYSIERSSYITTTLFNEHSNQVSFSGIPKSIPVEIFNKIIKLCIENYSLNFSESIKYIGTDQHNYITRITGSPYTVRTYSKMFNYSFYIKGIKKFRTIDNILSRLIPFEQCASMRLYNNTFTEIKSKYNMDLTSEFLKNPEIGLKLFQNDIIKFNTFLDIVITNKHQLL